MATRTPAPGMIHRSDRGVQCCRGACRAALEAWGLIACMSRAGDCYNNSAKDAFWETLKMELMIDREFETREEARAARWTSLISSASRTRSPPAVPDR